MRHAALSTAFALAITAAPALAAGDAHGLSQADQHFLNEASAGNLAEIHLGSLASSKGTTPAIREFGRWMESAHSFASRELSTITERMHGEAAPPKLEAAAAQAMGRLEGLSGERFDAAVLDTMIADHKKDLEGFGQEASGGGDFLVKSFAKNMVPAIREHLAEAESLRAGLSGRSAAEGKAERDAARGGVAPVTPPGK